MIISVLVLTINFFGAAIPMTISNPWEWKTFEACEEYLTSENNQSNILLSLSQVKELGYEVLSIDKNICIDKGTSL